MMNRILTLLTIAAACMTPARATTVLLTLNPANMLGNPGDELIYTGTITTDGDVFLNDIGNVFTGNPGFLVLNANTFFGSVPGFFQNGDSYTGPVFSIVIDPGAVAGVYFGTASLIGGSDQFGMATLASVNYQLVVAPEPSAASLMLAGLVLAARARRYRNPARTSAAHCGSTELTRHAITPVRPVPCFLPPAHSRGA